MAEDKSPGATADQVAVIKACAWARKKHRIKRPMILPKALCSCDAWQGLAPEGMGPIRQRDFLLDAWNDHMKVMRRIKLAAMKQEADWAQSGERSDSTD